MSPNPNRVGRRPRSFETERKVRFRIGSILRREIKYYQGCLKLKDERVLILIESRSFETERWVSILRFRVGRLTRTRSESRKKEETCRTEDESGQKLGIWQMRRLVIGVINEIY